MNTKIMAILSILLIASAAILIFYNFNSSVIASGPSDKIIMNLSDMKTCCTYTENGREKSCIIQERFDCSVCDEKCSPEQFSS